MTYQVLARRWRPQSFEQVVGQEHVLRALVNALDRQRLHHAYLLTGTRGVGKTTLARLIAKSLNCERGVSARPCGECGACCEIAEGRFIDLIEVDAASRTKVEDTRELLENVQYAPTRGRFKVYLIDEVHMLSGHSFNALLKTLEEPPPHVKFLLATTDPQRLPATVLSRCLQFHLKNLSPEQIAAHLAEVLRAEQVEFDETALWELGRAADGSMRDALSLSDQAIAYGGGSVRLEQVGDMLGHVNRELMHVLVDKLVAADGAGVLEVLGSLARQGTDCERVLVELLAILHRIALAQAVPASLEARQSERERLRAWADAADPQDVQLYYQIGLMCRRDMPHAPDPLSGLEMALLRMIAFRPADNSASLSPARTAAVSHPAPRASGDAGSGHVREGPGSAKKPEPAAAQGAGTAGRAERKEPESRESLTVSTVRLPASPAAIDAGNWRALLQALELGGMARNLALHALPEQATADWLAVVVGQEQQMLHNPLYEERIAAALSAHFGRTLGLRLRFGEPQGETPAAAEAREAAQRQQEAERAIENDPNVRLLIDNFDGRVHRSTIRAPGSEQGLAKGDSI